MLTAERLRELLDYDLATGVFTWRVRRGGTANIGTVAGRKAQASGYLLIRVAGAAYLAHRLAWLYIHGEFPPCKLDHRNGVRTDNRIANLRLANDSQNNMNKAMHSNNTSGIKGVFWHAGAQKWMASIGVHKRQKYLGLFIDKEASAAAYAQAAAEHFGEYARIVRG